jgi:hypothetical protein
MLPSICAMCALDWNRNRERVTKILNDVDKNIPFCCNLKQL